MKMCFENQAIEKQSSAACRVIEYPLNNKLLDIAIVKLSGRYPDEKYVVNLECAELAYVFEGKGKVVINNQAYSLNVGDAILIEAGEKYYWEGHMQLFLSCRPAWQQAQHQIID